jgi:hypothetical protein
MPWRFLHRSRSQKGAAHCEFVKRGLTVPEYTVTQDNSAFHVREGDASGPIIATFSNRLAAERFAESKR